MLRRPETKQVAAFLYDLLVANAPSRDYAKSIAASMGLPYPSLARYWQGRAVFPAGMVRPLFAATGHDVRVAEFFLLDGTGLRLDREDQPAEAADISRAVMHLNTLEGEISRLYLAATHEESESGPQISFGEARELDEALRKLLRRVEALRGAIREGYLKQ